MKHFITLITVFFLLLGRGQVEAQAMFTPCNNCIPGIPGAITQSALGDYDNDGDLDYVYGGYTNGSQTPYTYLYENQGPGIFSHNTSVAFTPLIHGEMAWIDYDGDGDLDFTNMGYRNTNDTEPHLQVYRNLGSRFDNAIELTGLGYGGLDWGDYDGDGDLDLLTMGATGKNDTSHYYTILYRAGPNNSFTKITTNLPALCWGTVKWSDYDNDGDPDVVICGQQALPSSSPATRNALSAIYRNDGNGIFTDIHAPLPAVSGAYAAWGDFDNDGHMDLAIQGMAPSSVNTYSSITLLKIFKNINNTFTDLNLNLRGNGTANLIWSDLNGDNKLDLVSNGGYATSVFLQSDANQFDIVPAFTNNVAPLSVGDCNGDHKPDLVAMDYTIYYNQNANAAPAPAVPDSLRAHGFGNGALMSWKGTSGGTGQRYNISIMRASQNTYIVPPMSISSTGFRQTTRDGNAGSLTSYVQRDLPPGAYNWTVQSQNGAGQASRFAAQGSFTVSGSSGDGVYVHNMGQDTLCYGQSTTLEALTYPTNQSFQWYRDGAAIPNATSRSYGVSQSGTYSVMAGDIMSEGLAIYIYQDIAAPAVTNAWGCSGQSVTLNATPGQGGNTCYWYDATGHYLSAGNSYTPIPPPSVSTPYKVYSYNTYSGCQSRQFATAAVTVTSAPDAPVATDQTACGNQSFVLTATPGANGNTCNWYSQAEGGNPLAVNTSSYTTPLLNQTTVYYVSTRNTATGCESAPRTPIMAEIRLITEAPVTHDAIGYGPCQVTLYASTPPNATTCRWYTNEAQSQLIHVGNSYTTPVLQPNTTIAYWVVGYNETTQCTGSATKTVRATIKPVPSVQLHPDQVYPTPRNILEEEYNDVNLFTGDVNLTLSVASISGPQLSYSLNAFYNSRSASITPYYTANTMGGLGWKLLDYPKIAYDAVKAKYFFLDGLAAYQLDTLQDNQPAQITTFVAQGKYATMSFTLNKTNLPVGSRKWTLINGKEEEYQFNSIPTGLANNGYLWSLSSVVDVARTDTINFKYDEKARLTSISNMYEDSINLHYTNDRLSTIFNSTATAVQERIVFSYNTNAFAPNASDTIFTKMETFRKVSGTNLWYPNAPATRFEYYPSGSVNPGALQTVTSPSGAQKTYIYTSRSLNNHTFRPVTGTAIDAGHLVHYEGNDLDVVTPEEIRYVGDTISSDGVYLQSNLTTIIPGKSVHRPLYKDANTSFEDGTKDDDIFGDLDKDDLKKDYPLTGTHSLKFDGAGNMSITSHRFDLDRNIRRVSSFESSISNPVEETGSLDSLTLSFYCLQTHKHIDVDFDVDFNFYDKDRKRIDNAGCKGKDYKIPNEEYGQWVPFKLRFGVPSNALYFDFKITGGSSSNGDFYMDDVSVSGTESNIQGELQYYFFNGRPANELRHLPDAYMQATEMSMLKKMYYSGFESGQTFSSWLDISDGPADVEFNTEQRHSSYNGTFSLRVGDYKGNRATIKSSNVSIPAGADHVLLSFHYSKPQFPGMQVRFTWGCSNAATMTQNLTLDGSYFIDPEYTYFQKVVPVNGASSFNFTIEIRDAGEKSDVNDFYIDDLTVLMLQCGGNLTPVNVRNPMLNGNLYFNRTFTNQYTELEVQSAVLMPATLSNNFGYVQTKEVNSTSSAVAHSGIEMIYNNHGMPTTATSHWARTNPDSTVTDVWTRTHFVYARDVWGAMLNNYEDQIALKWTEVSEDYFRTWKTVSGDLTQWKSFYTEGRTIWNPWRQFEMTVPASPSQINAVINGISSPSYTPPADQWIRTSRTDSISPQGNVIAAMISDMTPVYTQFSLRKLNTTNKKCSPLPVAAFFNGSPHTCLYYGFENYEKPPALFTGTPVSNYVFTGAASANINDVAFQLNFDSSGAGTTSYVMGAYIMAQSSTISFYISCASFNASHVFNVDISLQNVWHYYEWIVTIPVSSAILNFSMRSANGTSYVDDFRFSPITADMNATVYDITDYTIVAKIGNNADVTRLLYDRFGTLHGLTAPEEIPFSFTSTSYSRNGKGNQDHYNPNAPNVESNISVREGGAYFTMNDIASSEMWTFNNSSPDINPLHGLTLSSHVVATLANSKIPANRNDWGVSFRLLSAGNVSGTTNVGLDLGAAGLSFSFPNDSTIYVNFKSGSSWQRKDTLKPLVKLSYGMALDVDVVFQNGYTYVWVNGEVLRSTVRYSSSQVSQLKFSNNGNATILVNNICLFTDATLMATFADALGNPMQNQIITDAGVVIAETMYDRLNRPILQTQPVAFANVGLGFRASFITAMNWETGYLSGDITNGKAYIEGGGESDKGYLYWRNIYLKSPEEKVANQFNPGYNFALRSQTNWEKSKQWLYKHTGEIIEYGGYVLQAAGYVLDVVDCILAPEAAPLIIAMDATDLIVTVAQIVDEYGGTPSVKRQNSPITNYFYDNNQNLTSVYLPNANKTDHPAKNQTVEYHFDFRDHLDTENQPEAGRVDYIWSNHDLLRFSASGNDRDLNQVHYIKYDRQDRMIEKGFISGNMATDSAALKAAADDPNYPGNNVPHTILATFYWDGYTLPSSSNGNYLNRGRLTACKKWVGNTVTHVVQYGYNISGQVTSCKQNGKEITYTYDLVDNIKSIGYPATASGHNFTVNYSYNKFGQIKSINTSEDTLGLATMSYYPDGKPSLTQLNLKPPKGSIPLRYYYNAPGWLTSLTAGESSAHTGSSYKIDYFAIQLNYNVLDDWWSNFMDQAYYNGNIVNSTLTKGSKVSHLDSYKQGYQYSQRGQLQSYYSQEICELLPSSPCSNMTYTYDLNGNLKKEQVWADLTALKDGWSYERHYDETKNRVDRIDYYYADEVANYPDRNSYRRDTFFLQYDHSGNLIRRDYYRYSSFGNDKSHGQLNTIFTRQLTYDENNLVRTILKSRIGKNDTLITYTYSSEGYRIARSLTVADEKVSSTTYYRGFNGELLMEVDSVGSQVSYRYYVYGDESPFAMYALQGNVMNSWLVLSDQNGSATALVNRMNNNIDATYEYDAYGALQPDRCYNAEFYTLLFGGQEYDHDARVYNFRDRTYDPLFKIFLQQDPDKENLGLPYAFTEFDPVNYYDPYGDNILKGKTRKDGRNILKEKISEKRDFFKYTPGKLKTFVQNRSIRTNISKAEFIVMMESKSRRLVKELALIVAENKFRRKGQAAPQSYIIYQTLKGWLRPGDSHEMAPVSYMHHVVRLGIKMKRYQELTIPTKSTFFVKKDSGPKIGNNNEWNGPEIPHGGVGSPAAHKELGRLLLISKTLEEYLDNLALWSNGKLPWQKFSLGPTSIATLKGTRTIANVAYKFFR